MTTVVDRLIALGLSPHEAQRKAPIFDANDRALDAWSGDRAAAADPARLPVAPAPRLRWFVPGRIEVLGKHTDYAGGRSLICAVERGFCVTAEPRSDDLLRVVDVVNQVDVVLRVHVDQPEDTRWRTYPSTVARRVARNFPPAPGAPALRGADVAFGSDLPRAAGVSSSTALIIAVFTVLAEINALDRHPAYRANIPTIEALAAYLGCIENGRTFGTLTGDRGVGTRGGSQDHTAILLAEPGRLVAFGYSPPRVEQVVALPAGLTFLIGSSGVAAEKTGAARDDYNRASATVAAILDHWRAAASARQPDSSRAQDARRTTAAGRPATPPARDRARPAAPSAPAPTLFDVVAHETGTRETGVRETMHEAGTHEAGTREAGAHEASAHEAGVRAALRRVLAESHDARFSRDTLLARLDHFVREALEIIPQATAALARGDVDAFGALVDESQAAAERWLANQIPETIALARLARARGAIAASSFGAGFGGSAWALVRADDAPAFLTDWRHAYLAQFPAHTDRAVFFATSAGPPRSRL